MRKCASYLIYTVLLACIVCACSDDMDIKQDYEFKVTHLPVPKKLKVGEVAEIRCQLERAGRFEDARYTMRYFQSDGRGSLRMGSDKPFVPNDLYELPEETFRLYYTSYSEERAVIDIYFFDNMGNEFTLSFSFQSVNSNGEDKK